MGLVVSVAELTFAVISPGVNLTVAVEIQGVLSAGGNGDGGAAHNHFRGEAAAAEEGAAAVEYLLVLDLSDLIIGVVAPTPNGAIDVQGQRVHKARRNGLDSWQILNFNRGKRVGRFAIAKLTIGVAAERPHRAIFEKNQRMIAAQADLNDPGWKIQPLRTVIIIITGQTQLTISIVAPNVKLLIVIDQGAVQQTGR